MSPAKADVPGQFDQLSDQFFSLGRDDSHDARLNALGDPVRDAVLPALNDVAVSPDLFARALGEPVTGKSLLPNARVAWAGGAGLLSAFIRMLAARE